MPDQRTLLAQSLGGSSGGLLKADLGVIFVVQLVAHQGSAFVLDTAAPSVTHRRGLSARWGMNLLMIPLDRQGNICNIYLRSSEAEKRRNTGLGQMKTSPLSYFGNSFFLFFHCFHCKESAFLWVLLLTHIELGSNLAKSHSFTVVFVHAERNRQHCYFT